jgi:hypothetical protein
LRTKRRIKIWRYTLEPESEPSVAFIDGGTTPSRRIDLDRFPQFEGDEAWFWVDVWNNSKFTVLARCDPPERYDNALEHPLHKELRAYMIWQADPDPRPEDEPPFPALWLFKGRNDWTEAELAKARADFKIARADPVKFPPWKHQEQYGPPTPVAPDSWMARITGNVLRVRTS